MVLRMGMLPGHAARGERCVREGCAQRHEHCRSFIAIYSSTAGGSISAGKG
jgi:hypothetical protein